MRTIEALKNGMIMWAGFISIVSIAYAAISWPSTPSGEVDGGKYSARLVPSGFVGAFKTATCPTGWKPADGTNGNPDLRGEFIRGLDSGRGIDSGRTLASAQGASTLPLMYVYRSSSSLWILVTPSVSGYPTDGSSIFPWNVEWWGSAAEGNYYSANLTPNGNIGLTTFQVRPRNVALLYCVKD